MLCISKRSGDLHGQLQQLAGEIVSELTELAPERSEELLGVFVSALFTSVAEQSRREEYRRKQAEGIAAAKARGVRCGRAARPLPDNFDEVRQRWRRGEYTLQQAADACGMPRGTFYSASARVEQQNQAG